MEDSKIIALYWKRSEEAITQTEYKYGNYCRSISFHILQDEEDAKECVNDTYVKAWNAMPPQKPARLAAFLGKITRNLSLHRYEKRSAQKRGSGEMALALEELGECVSSREGTEQVIDAAILTEVINHFLASLSKEHRKIFMRRYWYLSSIKEIAEDYHMTESKVKMVLLRTRNELKLQLEKEGISL